MIWLKQIALYSLCSIFVVGTGDQSAETYCKDNICRRNNEHNLCKFSGPSPNCIEYEETLISEKDKQFILDKINSRRNKVASGEIRSLPAAGNMIKLEWNEELALLAQRWADQCMTENVENPCRDLENRTVGQNIATIMGESPGLSPYVLVDLWYIELLNINTSIISSYQSSPRTDMQHYDYFTQLVWGTTTRVGCGGAKFAKKNDILQNQKKTVYRLVCNFTPSGNRQGEEVYTTGQPCSKCPLNFSRDSEYPSLCSKDINEPEKFNTSSKISNLTVYSSVMDKISNDTEIKTSKTKLSNILAKEQQEDSVDSFDLLSHLFETSTTSTVMTSSTTKCKDVIAVEEFIRILKNKLNSEQLVRDFLYSTKTPSLDSPPSDENVKAVVQQIYSKKIPSTTTLVTESNHMNSTLLANLVEAIIFRKSDSLSTTHNPYTESVTFNNIRPIKIQASLGEVKVNNEFSGHLFFPEESEDEKIVDTETTESYYDTNDMPASDIAFEIESISKNTRTRNFLDEVLEEELLKEGATEGSSTSKMSRDKRKNKNNSKSILKEKQKYYINLIKRKEKERYVNYFDLLKKLAEDLRQLKIREDHSCSSNNANFNPTQTTIKNETTGITPNFKMWLDDLNRKKNLKLNFFDKMLSDEMLTIKKHIQEKDRTFLPHLNITANIPASTPTLEIKQKWPTLKNTHLTKKEDETKSTKHNITNPSTRGHFVSSRIYYNDMRNVTQNAKVQRRNNVVGVRSFTDCGNSHDYIEHDPERCKCVHEKTTCTGRYSAYTRCESCRSRSQAPLCTRTTTPHLPTTPYTFYPYVITYETPYLFIPPAEPPRSQKRKHKHKRPHTHPPTYDYANTYEDKVYEEEMNRDTENKHEMDSNDYKDEINEEKDKLEAGSLEANREQLVSNIIDDLKVYYNDAVIKDCYCSSWSNIFQTNCYTFYIIIFVIFLM